MNIRVLGLVALSVSLSAFAQISLKHGMASAKVQSLLLGHGLGMDTLVAILTAPTVAGGLLLYAIGALVWLLVLAHLDVSVAYPFMGLGFIVTMLLAAIVLNEPITGTKLVGTVLVVAGITMVGAR